MSSPDPILPKTPQTVFGEKLNADRALIEALALRIDLKHESNSIEITLTDSSLSDSSIEDVVRYGDMTIPVNSEFMYNLMKAHLVLIAERWNLPEDSPYRNYTLIAIKENDFYQFIRSSIIRCDTDRIHTYLIVKYFREVFVGSLQQLLDKASIWNNMDVRKISHAKEFVSAVFEKYMQEILKTGGV